MAISLKELVEMAERHCDTEKADAVEREKITGTFAKVNCFRQLAYVLIMRFISYRVGADVVLLQICIREVRLLYSIYISSWIDLEGRLVGIDA